MTPMSAAPSAPQKSAWPVIALSVSVASLCLGCLWPVGFALSIVAMVKTSKPPRMGRDMAIASLVVSVVAIVFLGIQVAIAIPNFIKFQARTKQAECKTNLRSLYTAAATQLVDEGRLGNLEELGLVAEPRNRYAYVLQLPDDVVPVGERETPLDAAALRDALRSAGVEPGVQGKCPECDITAACVGNVDSDDTLDVWSISSIRRTDADGNRVDPGALLHHVDDVRR